MYLKRRSKKTIGTRPASVHFAYQPKGAAEILVAFLPPHALLPAAAQRPAGVPPLLIPLPNLLVRRCL